MVDSRSDAITAKQQKNEGCGSRFVICSWSSHYEYYISGLFVLFDIRHSRIDVMFQETLEVNVL